MQKAIKNIFSNLKSKFFGKKDSEYAFLASVISILVGFILAILVLFVLEFAKADSDYSKPLLGIKNFFTYSFNSTSAFAKIFYNAAPLMLTGLAVGFAFKAGLFNIGATGQYSIGAFFALIAAILWQYPWWAALIVAIVAGAIWGSIPGIFKAFFNINEVITSIMLNWAALYMIRLIFFNLKEINTIQSDRTNDLSLANPSAIIPDAGLGELFNTSFINMGIIIALLVAIIIYIVLEKTVFGYEIKACGLNRNASLYAGVKAKKTIIMTMLISGALSGLAGGIVYLAGTVQYTTEIRLLAMGFNGIPVALLAYSNPLGIILSSVFIGFLESSGTGFQGLYSTEMTGIIVSVIIYFSAFSLIVSILIKNTIKKAQEKLALIKVNATKEESESSKDFKEVEKEEVPDKKGDEV